MNLRLALLGLALAGCFSASQRHQDDLMREARQFADDLRWGRWDQVGATMPAEEKRLFLERLDLVGNDLEMCDYEVKSIHFDHGSSEATVTVTIAWTGKSDPILHNATIEQRWESHHGHWILAKQRRSHGDRFPLVNEPATK